MNNISFNKHQFNDILKKELFYGILETLPPAKRVNYPTAKEVEYQKPKKVNYPEPNKIL